MQILSVLLLVLLLLPVMAILAFMPYLMRKTVSFGISVSEENYRSAPLRRMRKSYAGISSGLYGVIFLLCIYSLVKSGGEIEQTGAFGVYVVLTVVISIAMNLIFHFKMKKMLPSLPAAPAAQSVIAVDTGFRRNKLVYSNYWFLIHAAVIVISVIGVLANYGRIPEQIAMKFDIEGNIARSAAKSYRSVLFPNIMQAFMTLLFLFINVSILRSKQQTYAGAPEQSIRQNVLFRRRWSIFTILSGLALVLLFSFVQLNMIHPLGTGVITLVSFGVPVVIVLAAVFLSFTTGQGGSRTGRKEAGSGVQPVDDDRHWKLGSIYFNPQDPSIFVEKRTGIGWTFNFAHPAGWLILAGILIVIAAASFFAD
ncbi:DUF5808 domain-containing protein [Paenibacillus sp. M1]|uniref:DUF5808 domain-containing protein n=1 Tax=Paenibacillus haidiansis TaxID=1574488 RepID=A0ABU7VQV6_9BACL